jgi:hypothetical protein
VSHCRQCGFVGAGFHGDEIGGERILVSVPISGLAVTGFQGVVLGRIVSCTCASLKSGRSCGRV